MGRPKNWQAINSSTATSEPVNMSTSHNSARRHGQLGVSFKTGARPTELFKKKLSVLYPKDGKNEFIRTAVYSISIIVRHQLYFFKQPYRIKAQLN